MTFVFNSRLLLTALFLFPVQANASTISSFTQSTLGGLCSSDSATSGAVGSSCGSFANGDGIDARATFGDIGLRSQVNGRSLGGSAPEDADFWRGGAFVNDVLFFGVESGTFRLFTDIAASLIENVTGEFAGSSFPAGRNVFSVQVGSTTIFQRSHEYQNGSSGLAELLYVDDLGSTGVGFVDLTFTGGMLDLSIGMSVETTCGAQHRGNIVTGGVGTCLLGVDAFNSLRLIGSSGFDDLGMVVGNGFLNAESGFDYSVGVDPHNPSPIPIPAAFPLLVGALGMLWIGGRRRSVA